MFSSFENEPALSGITDSDKAIINLLDLTITAQDSVGNQISGMITEDGAVFDNSAEIAEYNANAPEGNASRRDSCSGGSD